VWRSRGLCLPRFTLAHQAGLRDISRIVTWTTHRGVIFTADDEPGVRENLQDALEDAGYLVLSARDGKEALARMRGTWGPSLAIVDLNMPTMSGWELIERMRSDRELSCIPILVLSANGNEPVRGADRLLRKPVTIEELLRNVQELLA
jgi:two-component system, chemotaxis family, sensor histidine kinase and response regulator PixL